jgi:hypothetical protein
MWGMMVDTTNGDHAMDTREQLRERIDELQTWFAGKPYGWRDTATPGQRQQWTDRVAEHDRLEDRLLAMDDTDK